MGQDGRVILAAPGAPDVSVAPEPPGSPWTEHGAGWGSPLTPAPSTAPSPGLRGGVQRGDGCQAALRARPPPRGQGRCPTPPPGTRLSPRLLLCGTPRGSREPTGRGPGGLPRKPASAASCPAQAPSARPGPPRRKPQRPCPPARPSCPGSGPPTALPAGTQGDCPRAGLHALWPARSLGNPPLPREGCPRPGPWASGQRCGKGAWAEGRAPGWHPAGAPCPSPGRRPLRPGVPDKQATAGLPLAPGQKRPRKQ